MAKIKVTDKDLGYKKILRSLSKLSAKPYVKVGILESAGKHDESDLTVAEIMSIHEYGAPSVNIPERAPIRKTLDTNKAEIQNNIDKLFGKVIDGAIDPDDALKVIGEDVKAKIQSTITNGLTPPWAPSTLARKAARSGGIAAIVPLIDTGQMLRSIDYEVVLVGTSSTEGGKVVNE